MESIRRIGWFGLFIIVCMSIVPGSFGRPRLALPPIPEGQLASWRFNGSLEPDSPVMLSSNLKTVESWSGYALEMTGTESRSFTVSSAFAGKDAGTIRFWFAPNWSSGAGPGGEARLLEFGEWNLTRAQAHGSLSISPQGTAIRFFVLSGTESVQIFRTSIDWCAGEWHQVAISWSSSGVVLHVDGKEAAEGLGVVLFPPAALGAASGFCLGSDVNGNHLAQGQFEELTSFARVCSDSELEEDFQRNATLAALGSITPEEEKAMFAAMAESAAQSSLGPESMGESSNDGCGIWLHIDPEPNDAVKLTLHNTTPGQPYEIWSTPTLASPTWALEQTVNGDAGQNYTQRTILKNGRATLFFIVGRPSYILGSNYRGLAFDYNSAQSVPDTMGAIGPNHFIEVLNDGHTPNEPGAMGLFSKSGVLIENVQTDDFFAVAGHQPLQTQDSRILYDPASARWIACTVDIPTDDIVIAISTSANPENLTSAWTRYAVVATWVPPGLSHFVRCDHPTLAVDANGIYVSVTQFDHDWDPNPCVAFGCRGHTIIALQKSKLFGEGIFDPKTKRVWLDELFARVIQPAVNFDSSPMGGYTWFLTKTLPQQNPYRAGEVMYRRLVWENGELAWVGSWAALSDPSYLNYYDFEARDPNNPFTVPSLGGGVHLRHNPSGVLTAVIRDGVLWTCQPVGLDGADGDYDGDATGNSVDRTGAQWLKLQLGTPVTLTSHGRIFDSCPSSPYYYYFPSMMVNSRGDMLVGFSASKATTYIGAYYSWRLADGSTPNKPFLIGEGVGIFGDSRFGDYSHTTVDPSDGLTFWTVQEYSADPIVTAWGTWIGKIRPLP